MKKKYKYLLAIIFIFLVATIVLSFFPPPIIDARGEEVGWCKVELLLIQHNDTTLLTPEEIADSKQKLNQSISYFIGRNDFQSTKMVDVFFEPKSREDREIVYEYYLRDYADNVVKGWVDLEDPYHRYGFLSHLVDEDKEGTNMLKICKLWYETKMGTGLYPEVTNY